MQKKKTRRLLNRFENNYFTCFIFRYIHEHALNHYLDTSHPLVIDVNELYVYCYECEEYVLNDNKSGDIKVLRETLQVNHM